MGEKPYVTLLPEVAVVVDIVGRGAENELKYEHMLVAIHEMSQSQLC